MISGHRTEKLSSIGFGDLGDLSDLGDFSE